VAEFFAIGIDPSPEIVIMIAEIWGCVYPNFTKEYGVETMLIADFLARYDHAYRNNP
jgi:hypothetical protein